MIDEVFRSNLVFIDHKTQNIDQFLYRRRVYRPFTGHLSTIVCAMQDFNAANRFAPRSHGGLSPSRGMPEGQEVKPAISWALWRLRRTTPPLPTQTTQVCDRGDPWFISGRPGYFGWSDPGLFFAYDPPRKGKRKNLSPADPPSKRLRPISKLFLRWV